MTTRSILPTLSLLLCGSLLGTPAASQDAAAWAHLLRGTSTMTWAAAPRLVGGLRPMLGRTATIGLEAPNFHQASLLVGLQASDGLALNLFGTPLLLYVPQPIAVVPMTMQSGHASYSLPIPDTSALVGLDLAMQAVTATTTDIGLSNLLIANLGRTAGSWSDWSYEFHGTAKAQQRTANGRIYTGDVEGLGISTPVFSGSNENVWLTVIADRPLTSTLEVRTAPNGAGQLLGSTMLQHSVVSLALPQGSPVHLYLHNTDANRGVDLTWKIALY